MGWRFEVNAVTCQDAWNIGEAVKGETDDDAIHRTQVPVPLVVG